MQKQKGVFILSTVELNESNKDNFKEMITNSDKPVVVDFWGTGCQPCAKMAPELAALIEEMPNDFQLIKVNVGDFQELAAKDYKIFGVPTLIVFKDGEEKERLVGYKPKEEIKKFVAKYL